MRNPSMRVGPAAAAQPPGAASSQAAGPASGSTSPRASRAPHVALDIEAPAPRQRARPAAASARTAAVPSQALPPMPRESPLTSVAKGAALFVTGAAAVAAGSFLGDFVFTKSIDGQMPADEQGGFGAATLALLGTGAAAVGIGASLVRTALHREPETALQALDAHPAAQQVAQVLQVAMQHLPPGEARPGGFRDAVRSMDAAQAVQFADRLLDLASGPPAVRQEAVIRLAAMEAFHSAVAVQPAREANRLVNDRPDADENEALEIAMGEMTRRLFPDDASPPRQPAASGGSAIPAAEPDRRVVLNTAELVSIGKTLKQWKDPETEDAMFARRSEPQRHAYWSGVAQALHPEATPIRGPESDSTSRNGRGEEIPVRPEMTASMTPEEYGQVLFDSALAFARKSTAAVPAAAASEPGPSNRG